MASANPQLTSVGSAYFIGTSRVVRREIGTFAGCSAPADTIDDFWPVGRQNVFRSDPQNIGPLASSLGPCATLPRAGSVSGRSRWFLNSLVSKPAARQGEYGRASG